MEEKPQILIKNIWKVFGRDPKRVLKKNLKGLSKEEIKKKTKCILGLRNINLEVKKGEFYILMGLSGSGKSTLLRNLIRLVKPTSGSIIINDKDITTMNNEELLNFRRKTFGMVFQHYGLFPHLTVIENAAYGLKVKGISKEERDTKALEVLETVGLKGWEYNYPGNLSGGMQQRVGIARAIVNDPEILLMDEPFSGLDPLIRREMQDELVEMQDKLKITIVFVTHDLHEALKLGDKIAILRDGEVVQVGTPEDIVTNPEDEYVQEFIKDASLQKVLTAGSIMEQSKVLLYAWEGPKTALTLLRKGKKKSSFIVDKGHKFLGRIFEKDLVKLIEENSDIKEIPDRIIKHVESVDPEITVEEMFPLMAKDHKPIPVVNSNGKYKGYVTADQIFESISITEGGDND